ncbi:MAG: hypothetical protein RML94_13835 [Bacteroidia bacterium]|nr:hypothetical protein [Bacteroidia bacterium]
MIAKLLKLFHIFSLVDYLTFLGVSLADARVGVLRATLSLRCYANAPHC